ncbi:YeeE/YedE family integral membrane protein [Talaromyces proteolyticus]|uniref:YeeE/YedE family integral membrane protein n=1 Tax=Talaromyces proteolyticus TaxID=1131652 RepID=A0AAD4KMQ3_9EURO|nr:YeeE/YedE family integral membrane protein [Talaromyces proteolyticus]KAH8693860.1 YeeE/YedE family integral membrane protein [Talaromyces proteolyticus]
MFTPVHTSLGALLLFSGSFGLLVHNGRVFGISSMLRSGLVRPDITDENVAVLAGLLSSPWLVWLFVPSLLPAYPDAVESWTSVVSTLGLGFLVGWGTKNGAGCTSGHMLCGISRLSARSLLATGIFFTTALLTATYAPVLTGSQIIPICREGPCYHISLPTIFELSVMTTSAVLAILANFAIGPQKLLLSRLPTSRSAFAYLAGVQFGLGLLFTGMADPAKVIRFFAFLTDLSAFDPSLALVLVFGVGPSLYWYLATEPGKANAEGKVDAPTLADSWSLPNRTLADVDWRFVAGAVAFGLGWGLSGVCPGPAIVRSVLQPAWGVVWMAGYAVGSRL